MAGVRDTKEQRRKGKALEEEGESDRMELKYRGATGRVGRVKE